MQIAQVQFSTSPPAFIIPSQKNKSLYSQYAKQPAVVDIRCNFCRHLVHVFRLGTCMLPAKLVLGPPVTTYPARNLHSRCVVGLACDLVSTLRNSL